MDHVMENAFLNKEKQFMAVYKEQDAAYKMDVGQQVYLQMGENFLDQAMQDPFEKAMTNTGPEDRTNMEFQIYESFVKEKLVIIGYTQEMLIDVSKTHLGILEEAEINEKIFSNKQVIILESKVKDESDLKHIKYRIMLIVQLEKYQEQPGVLDSILEQFVTPIFKALQIYVKRATQASEYDVPPKIANLFEMLQWLCKVRGYKTVVKFFPHEVPDMEPVVELLHFQENDRWWIQYVLIIWLSIIVLVPFDIETIDSKKQQEILIKRMINIGRNYIHNPGRLRDASSVLLSKLLTRPDVIKSGETDLFLSQMAVEYLQAKDDANQMFCVQGILQTLVEIFKVGHREDLLPRVKTIFDPVLKGEVKNKFMNKSTNLRKHKTNLAQRIGCIFLKPKVAKWRYQRGFRSLQDNLKQTLLQEEGKGEPDQEMKIEHQEEEDEDEDIDFDQLEFIIQFLLDSLKDDDNVVRWTSAKGLGRITGRLSKDFADQIVQQLLDTLFGPEETDSSWHGGCLALAELCRRGLLLPDKIDKFIPTLSQALIYDINRGNFSVGAHVRDSACYVVWSFARAYAPEIMKPHVTTLSSQLIVESLFDREVNCRRAASATFQECVGRQGNFPHGIEILTEADYFTLSNRINAYLNVSCFVAQYQDYYSHILQHLFTVKLKHWEPQMRVLASQAISVLACFQPKYIVNEILAPLVSLCVDKALHIRHGAIFGVSEIIIGLSGNSIINRKNVLEKAFKSLSNKERKLIEEENAQKKAFREYYESVSSQNLLFQELPEGAPVLVSLKQIIKNIEDQRLYRGKGGEIMRGGVSHLIYAMSLAKISFTHQEKMYLVKVLQENFKHPTIEIQEEATKAFHAFCESYLQTPEDISGETGVQMMKFVQGMYKASMTDENIAITRGYNMAFGVLSKSLADALGAELIEVVAKNCVPKGNTSDEAETRRYSVRSLIALVQRKGLSSMTVETVQMVQTTLYKCLNDYAVDRRGDVGSWVREEGMDALREFIKLLVVNDNQQLKEALGAQTPAFYQNFVNVLLQQMMEKIDKVREIAGQSLQLFFKYEAPLVCDFADKAHLQALFTQSEGDQELVAQVNEAKEEIAYLPWRSAEFVFQQVLPFFDSDVYSHSILKGLITSSGGLTESTLKASSNSLFEYLSAMNLNQDKEQALTKKASFLGKLLAIFEQSLKDERVTIPLMKTIELLLTSDYISDVGLIPQLTSIHTLTVQECNKSKSIAKLTSASGVYAGLLLINDLELQKKSVRSMLFLLYHSFPKVRKVTSEKLYTGLLSMEDFSGICSSEENFELAQEMISSADWSEKLEVLKGQKEVLFGLFGLEVGKGAPQKTVEEEKKNDDEEFQIKT